MNDPIGDIEAELERGMNPTGRTDCERDGIARLDRAPTGPGVRCKGVYFGARPPDRRTLEIGWAMLLAAIKADISFPPVMGFLELDGPPGPGAAYGVQVWGWKS